MFKLGLVGVVKVAWHFGVTGLFVTERNNNKKSKSWVKLVTVRLGLSKVRLG